MSDGAIVEVGPAELGQIVADVFGTMMGLPVTACDSVWFPSADRLTAAVYLDGEWRGAVMIEFGRRQACRLAGRFLSMEAPAEVDDVVRDVAGEIANMIAGNLKCVLLPGIRISMPSVVNGADYSVHVCGSGTGQMLAFSSEEGLFCVRVLRQNETR